MMGSLSTAEFVQMVEFEKGERVSRIINSTSTGVPGAAPAPAAAGAASAAAVEGTLMYKKDKRTSYFASKVANAFPHTPYPLHSLPHLAPSSTPCADTARPACVWQGWSACHFKLENRVLLCYEDARACQQQAEPLRAIPLSECELFTVKREKYQWQFELVNNATTSKYQLRAANQAEYERCGRGLFAFPGPSSRLSR